MPRGMYRLKEHALPEVVEIPCCFQPQGAGAVTVVKQTRCSVARTGVGQYTVTFTDPWTQAQLIGVEATLQMNAVTDLKLQLGAFTAGSAQAGTGSSIIVTALAVGVATEIAANANNTIFLNFSIQTSTVPS